YCRMGANRKAGHHRPKVNQCPGRCCMAAGVFPEAEALKNKQPGLNNKSDLLKNKNPNLDH
ncbi:hypothetical protein J7E71_20255, partial [Mesobacillus foraminis]|uniref:hypothetical protein n=1 Tax=Mesobacillus foraminis TaxID=279826 RepID=UPI001BE80AF5